ncbi:MAG: tyrosine-type recombinase/integrase [Mycobacterium sp.]|uniref:tyrosine-type recombinase/integrase n=1 Tax=Mycobacterium sp. TaxID=1785 RepID=UPI003F94F48D
MNRNRRAGVEDRWTKTIRDDHGNAQKVPSARHGTGLRWLARYVDDEGREHSKAFDRKADAKAWLDTVLAAHVTGSYVDPQLGKITFDSFYREWSGRQVWVSGTRHAMDLACGSVTFGHVPLAELRPSHVETWVKSMQDKGLEPTTIRTRFANVRNVIRAAVRDRSTPRDVTDRVRLPRQRKASSAMAIPASDQVGAVMRAADDQFAAFIAVCAFAGLRRGEASALRVSDVDFLRKEIRVAQQVQWTADGEMEIRPPKYASERTVYIPDRLVTLLAEYVRRYRPGDDPDRWLFPGSRDAQLPAHAATVARSWRIARDRVGMTNRLHDLRHFYASGLIRAGCDVVTVQRALGHSSAAITLTTYSHLWPDANDRTRTAAGELLAASLKSAADLLRTESEK